MDIVGATPRRGASPSRAWPRALISRLSRPQARRHPCGPPRTLAVLFGVVRLDLCVVLLVEHALLAPFPLHVEGRVRTGHLVPEAKAVVKLDQSFLVLAARLSASLACHRLTAESLPHLLVVHVLQVVGAKHLDILYARNTLYLGNTHRDLRCGSKNGI